MSLEAAIAETNELLRAIHVALQSGLQAQATLGEPDASAPRGRGRPKKVDTVAAPPTPAETEAARAKHAAGEHLNGGEATAALFGHANAPAPVASVAPVSAPQPVVAPVTPAPAAVAPVAPAVEFPTVLAAFLTLNQSAAPGHGREGVVKILAHYLPGDPKPSVPKLAALGRNAEILAAVQALLGAAAAPAVEEPYDPLA